MTKRSVFLGLMGAALVCGACFFNDWVLRQTYLVGNNMPAAIYGMLILVTLLLNPRLHKRALTGGELAVIMALTLAGAAVPGGGLVRTLIPSLVIPHHLEKTTPGWKQEGIVQAVSPRMLVDITEDEDRVVNGYVQGLGEGDRHIRLSEVPWRAWRPPLLFWLPVALTLWIALIGLSVAMHRQWSEHERLPYPIARFTDAVLPKEGESAPALWRERLFWIGTAIVFSVHLNNYAYTWFPNELIRIPTRFDLTALGRLFPVFVRGGGSALLRPHIYLIIIGIAYFIPSDVSLSFGVGPFLWYTLMGIFAFYGINLTAPRAGISYFSLKPQSFALFGANVGVIAAMAFTGRRFYLAVARRAFGLRGTDSVDATSVCGFRTFVGATLILLVQFRLIGIDFALALPYTLFMIMGFVVLSRVIAETGLIYLKCYFWPCTVLWGLFGARAIGPQQLLLMMMVSTILFIDPREALMPFMVNSLKVLELRRVKLLGTSGWCVVALIIGLAVAVPVTLYIKYDLGSATGDSWSTITVPKVPFDNGVVIRRRLKTQGVAVDESGSFLSRLGDMAPNWVCVSMMAAGFVLVIGFTVARLRFAWWPLHPLLFVTWASTPLRWMGFSYLLGWLVKTTVSRYGGSHTYNHLKPLMFGLITGEILGALFPTLFGALYYLITNDQPRMFNVIPG